MTKSKTKKFFSNSRSRSHMALALTLAALAVAPCLRADTFIKPTKEELEMTSLPGYPGASAVVLYREQITRDDLHTQQFYDRIKILTEDGKKYANVELPFVSSMGDGEYTGDDKSLGDIQGRTIHPDGSIIPFTGKPYLKVIEKGENFKVQERIFTLPDVEVGSIIEYRYATRYNDMVYEAPDWYIQGELYLKAAHYVWYPTTHEMLDTEADAVVSSISWFPILPPGVQIVHHDLPGHDASGLTPQIYELSIKDVPPIQHEEYMPPIASFSYRVLYNFTPYRSGDEYWKARGKTWSKHADSFIGPNSDLRNATQPIIAGATTDDQKLRKIYATIMTLDNTDYSRQHEQREDKAAGLGKVNNAADVLTHKRGSGREMAELFVGMARAAGLKAYLMIVTDRSERLFSPGWLNFTQLDNTLAIVSVDGKEAFFDPGSRYCPYGRLEWENTYVQGLRQGENGTSFGSTGGPIYSSNITTRVANLYMDEQGAITGSINLSFAGDAAISWRHRALRGDPESLRHALRVYLEDHLPKSLQVSVTDIKDIDDYEKPLAVDYKVKGTLGTPTGKRLLLPVDVFLTQQKPAFPHDKRELAVYFHYPELVKDAMRINFPKNMSLEAAPASSTLGIKGSSTYTMSVTPAPDNITSRRTFAYNEILYKPDDYTGLRTFYNQFEAKDQESIVLKLAPVESSSVTPTATPSN
jgi:hypothetical protein